MHPEMEAYVLVVPTRYYEVVGPDGTFALEHVPAGDYVLHAWHERSDSYAALVRIGPGAPVELEVAMRMATR